MLKKGHKRRKNEENTRFKQTKYARSDGLEHFSNIPKLRLLFVFLLFGIIPLQGFSSEPLEVTRYGIEGKKLLIILGGFALFILLLIIITILVSSKKKKNKELIYDDLSFDYESNSDDSGLAPLPIKTTGFEAINDGDHISYTKTTIFENISENDLEHTAWTDSVTGKTLPGGTSIYSIKELTDQLKNQEFVDSDSKFNTSNMIASNVARAQNIDNEPKIQVNKIEHTEYEDTSTMTVEKTIITSISENKNAKNNSNINLFDMNLDTENANIVKPKNNKLNKNKTVIAYKEKDNKPLEEKKPFSRSKSDLPKRAGIKNIDEKRKLDKQLDDILAEAAVIAQTIQMPKITNEMIKKETVISEPREKAFTSTKNTVPRKKVAVKQKVALKQMSANAEKNLEEEVQNVLSRALNMETKDEIQVKPEKISKKELSLEEQVLEKLQIASVETKKRLDLEQIELERRLKDD